MLGLVPRASGATDVMLPSCEQRNLCPSRERRTAVRSGPQRPRWPTAGPGGAAASVATVLAGEGAAGRVDLSSPSAHDNGRHRLARRPLGSTAPSRPSRAGPVSLTADGARPPPRASRPRPTDEREALAPQDRGSHVAVFLAETTPSAPSRRRSGQVAQHRSRLCLHELPQAQLRVSLSNARAAVPRRAIAGRSGAIPGSQQYISPA
jgi:hypothetical protein